MLVALAGGWLGWDARSAWQDPLPWPAEQRLELRQGESLRALIDRLRSDGRIPRHWSTSDAALAGLLRLRPDWGALQAGTYALYPGDSLLGLLERMRQGDVLEIMLTVVEGIRFVDLRQQLETHPDLVADTRDWDSSQLATALDLDQAYLEGRFLPDTYRVPVGTPVSRVLRRLARAMDVALAAAWAQVEVDSPLQSADELLILASIIEKETGAADERRTISGVFHRRLVKNMRLQTDPTVIYGLGDAFDGNLTRAHLRSDTPWNTYTRFGLPVSPICLPGLASLQAAADPEEGDALYFVSTGAGRHVFSATLEQHNAAVRRYQLGQR